MVDCEQRDMRVEQETKMKKDDDGAEEKKTWRSSQGGGETRMEACGTNHPDTGNLCGPTHGAPWILKSAKMRDNSLPRQLVKVLTRRWIWDSCVTHTFSLVWSVQIRCRNRWCSGQNLPKLLTCFLLKIQITLLAKIQTPRLEPKSALDWHLVVC